MAVSLDLYLFGKPGQELPEGEEVSAQDLRALGESLQARLAEAADLTEKLTGAGWEVQMGLYDLFFSHPYIETAAQAEAKLQDLGIDPDRINIDEWEDEDDVDDEVGL